MHCNVALGRSPIPNHIKMKIKKELENGGFKEFKAICGCDEEFVVKEEKEKSIIFSNNKLEWPDISFNIEEFTFSEVGS